MTPKTLLVAACAASLACAGQSSVAAATPGPKARIFAKYDANKNNVIDGEEIVAVRKAFAAEPKGEFASYDKNADGKLDDAEIAGIKPPGAGGKTGEKKAGEGKKKAGAETPEKK